MDAFRLIAILYIIACVVTFSGMAWNWGEWVERERA